MRAITGLGEETGPKRHASLITSSQVTLTMPAQGSRNPGSLDWRQADEGAGN